MEKIKEFVAVRTFRQARLDRTFMDYENLNEYKEGLRNILNTSLCALVRISVQLKRCIINRDSMATRDGADIRQEVANKLETNEFNLSGCNYEMKKEGNTIEIQLK
jgi:hypothetical protein